MPEQISEMRDLIAAPLHLAYKTARLLGIAYKKAKPLDPDPLLVNLLCAG